MVSLVLFFVFSMLGNGGASLHLTGANLFNDFFSRICQLRFANHPTLVCWMKGS